MTWQSKFLLPKVCLLPLTMTITQLSVNTSGMRTYLAGVTLPPLGANMVAGGLS